MNATDAGSADDRRCQVTTNPKRPATRARTTAATRRGPRRKTDPDRAKWQTGMKHRR